MGRGAMPFSKTLVFDLPSDASHPKLLVTAGSWFDRLAEPFIVGDDDSLFHKHTVFRFDQSTQLNLLNQETTWP